MSIYDYHGRGIRGRCSFSKQMINETEQASYYHDLNFDLTKLVSLECRGSQRHQKGVSLA